MNYIIFKIILITEKMQCKKYYVRKGGGWNIKSYEYLYWEREVVRSRQMYPYVI